MTKLEMFDPEVEMSDVDEDTLDVKDNRAVPDDKVEVVDTQVAPEGKLEILTRAEISKLLDQGQGGLHEIFRNCALAVLSSGSYIDDGKELLERYATFDITIIQRERGIKLDIKGAPATAFVDNELIRGIHEHLFSVLRDVLFINEDIETSPKFDLDTSAGITDAIFHILRNANVLRPKLAPNLVVCWGGHSISGEEYDYSKRFGYEAGLRGLDICTGCGPGAMKGPMKGASLGHNKQRIANGRYLGISEPGIIAAESPNPIVNDLVVLPDIEKRLEAFVRVGHGIVIFPGGAGTAEEILYLLGILLHPDNAKLPFPLIFTGPRSSGDYFRQIDDFIGCTLGPKAQERYQIIMDDPELVAREMVKGIQQVREFRRERGDAFYFNWTLKIDHEFQQPFLPTHANMRSLNLHKNQEPHMLAADLRRAFSGVVAGNVKAHGIRAIEEHGHFEIHGDSSILKPMDELLNAFVRDHRMRLPGKTYVPCYRIVK